ncbi:MAG: IS3 family transposase, partial [Rhodospirillum sp.]|nr:IS3 family transposase [Rhodospirillum sp.]
MKREVDHLRMERDILRNCLHHIRFSEMKFRPVADCREDDPVRVLCRVLVAPASGYYAWRHRPESPRKAEIRRPLGDIQRLH